VNDPFHTINYVNFITRKKREREQRIKKSGLTAEEIEE
jgi:hypothetical protein